jgi:hypothetical protein
MIVQWCMKGLSLPGDVEARAIIDSRAGLLSNWWRAVGTIKQADKPEKLTAANLDLIGTRSLAGRSATGARSFRCRVGWLSATPLPRPIMRTPPSGRRYGSAPTSGPVTPLTCTRAGCCWERAMRSKSRRWPRRYAILIRTGATRRTRPRGKWRRRSSSPTTTSPSARSGGGTRQQEHSRSTGCK